MDPDDGSQDPEQQRVLYYLRRFNVLSVDEEHPEAWVDMARRATEELPHQAFTWRSLVFTLDRVGRIQEAIATCRAALQRGHADLRVTLALAYPKSLEPEEFEQVCTQAPVDNLEHVTMALLEARRTEWAAWCARVLIERLDLTSVRRWHPSPRWFARVVLRLRMDDAPGLARELHERYAAWRRAEGLVEDVFTGPKAVVPWRTMAALDALPDFHPALRALLFQRVWDGDKGALLAGYLGLCQRDPLGIQLSEAALCVQDPELVRILGLPSRIVRG
jgi:hypothetical protein